MSSSPDNNYTENSVEIRCLNIISFLIAVILVLRFFTAFKSYSDIIQEIIFLSLVIPAFIFILNGLGDIKLFLKSFFVTFIYIIPVTFSFIFIFIKGNANQFFATITFCNVIVMFVLASLFASSNHNELLPKTMRTIALLATPLFIYVALTQQNAYVWGRWEPVGGHPNWWGMMGLGLAWCSFAWKNIFLRIFFMGVGLYFMFLTQSRGSMVAFLPAFLFCSGYFFPFTRRKALILLIVALVGIVAILALSYATSYDILGKLYHFFANDVLKINDPNRGLGSGMTGRVSVYATSWQAFLGSPFFGAGYSEFASVHNGFLIILVESGIFAFLGLISLFSLSIKGFVKSCNWQELGLILSYMVLLLTFPRTFNINMVSLLFMMILMKGIALNFANNQSENRNSTIFLEQKISP